MITGGEDLWSGVCVGMLSDSSSHKVIYLRHTSVDDTEADRPRVLTEALVVSM